jgi:hypothetical protein
MNNIQMIAIIYSMYFKRTKEINRIMKVFNGILCFIKHQKAK